MYELKARRRRTEMEESEVVLKNEDENKITND
jgi:hypothetical protein